MDFGLILDIVIVLLLVPTIIYAVMLDRQLKVLRKSRQELVRLIDAFNEATHRAEVGLPKLRQLAKDARGGLQEQVERAQSIRDDLAYMNERSEAMIESLEKTVRAKRDSRPANVANRESANTQPKTQQPEPTPPMSAGFAPSAPKEPPPRTNSQPNAAEGRAKTMLGAMALGHTNADEDTFGEGRSESERELLKAMQSMK